MQIITVLMGLERTAAMGKLIEVEKFKKDLLENYAFSGFPDLLKDFCSALDSQPTVDAVPVRRGRWEHHPEIGWGSTWLCSECGEKTVETVMGEPRYKFCPMCGADMRKDGERG